VNVGQRWYLVAWDLDRADWRTFRVDRLREGMSPGPGSRRGS
jgi:predicted DNA-binding transcriptional regulator YafY